MAFKQIGNTGINCQAYDDHGNHRDFIVCKDCGLEKDDCKCPTFDAINALDWWTSEDPSNPNDPK
jgi:hypothetical protein